MRSCLSAFLPEHIGKTALATPDGRKKRRVRKKVGQSNQAGPKNRDRTQDQQPMPMQPVHARLYQNNDEIRVANVQLKFETRNSNTETAPDSKPEYENCVAVQFEPRSFEFVSNFDNRISDLNAFIFDLTSSPRRRSVGRLSTCPVPPGGRTNQRARSERSIINGTAR